MMFTYVLLGCLAVARCAPAEEAAAQVVSAVDKMVSMQSIDMKPLHPTRKYLLLNPDAHRQFQPSGNMKKPLFEPLALFGSGSTKGKFQKFCDRMQNAGGLGGLSDSFLGNLFVIDDFDDDDNDEEENDRITTNETFANQRVPEINTDAETIPEGIIPNGNAPQTPTNDRPVVREHRFYTIAGPPQFFGNVDILNDPLHPIFSIQPLQAIKMKSSVESRDVEHTNEIPSSGMNPDDKENTSSDSNSDENLKHIDLEGLTTNKDATTKSTENVSSKNDKKELKKDTNIPEWDSVNPSPGKTIESAESKESKEVSSEDLANSSANRLNVNFVEQQLALTTVERNGRIPKK